MVALRLFTIDARTTGGDRHALTRRIAAAGADIACVHNAPSLLRWRSHCAAIGRESGLVTVAGGRTGGGTLLLSTLGVALGPTRDLVFPDSRGLRPAGAALASLTRLGSPFVLAGARLDADRTLQRAQAADVLRGIGRLDSSGPPSIVCVADAGPGAAVALQDGRVTAAPGVFVDPRITVGEAGDGTIELELP